MATYKVIQDIEAEDKFVGPLTLKQFVFAMTGCFFAWVSFMFVTTFIYGLAISLPLCLFGFFMAFPWSKEQPTDVWVLAKIRFYFKPKVRIWDQAGRQDLVTITAPKKIEKHLTKDFSETEVKSRLKALAETIDSRGWVVKHAAAGTLTQVITPTDRLVDTGIILPQQIVDKADDVPDIMDNTRVDGMLDETDDRRRNDLIEKMDQIRRGELKDFSEQSKMNVDPPEDDSPRKSKNTADRIDEMLLSDKIKAKRKASEEAYSRMSKIPSKPLSVKADDDDDDSKKTKVKTKTDKSKLASNDEKKSTSTMTEQISPDILNLARNNDLNVATIARQVNKSSDGKEVTISLH
jgi:hypothetical protein